MHCCPPTTLMDPCLVCSVLLWPPAPSCEAQAVLSRCLVKGPATALGQSPVAVLCTSIDKLRTTAADRAEQKMQLPKGKGTCYAAGAVSLRLHLGQAARSLIWSRQLQYQRQAQACTVPLPLGAGEVLPQPLQTCNDMARLG